jgi:hypothetical protein
MKEMVVSISIKKVRRLMECERPDALARYLLRQMPAESRKDCESAVGQYAQEITKKEFVDKRDVERRLEGILNSNRGISVGQQVEMGEAPASIASVGADD